jgi:hypothetical protein
MYQDASAVLTLTLKHFALLQTRYSYAIMVSFVCPHSQYSSIESRHMNARSCRTRSQTEYTSLLTLMLVLSSSCYRNCVLWRVTQRVLYFPQ